MTRAECIRELREVYQKKRSMNEEQAEARYDQAVALDPEIGRLREENALLAINTMKRMSMMQSVEERQSAAREMRDRGKENNKAITCRLVALGLPEDHLSIHYSCNICKDTGLVGEAPSRFCECFERALRTMIFEDGSMSAADVECFENFDENRLPEADGQREQALRNRDICMDYADTFPNTRFKNLVLTGMGGLGKTFFLNSIYVRVVQNGGEAIRITAYRMFEAMRKQYFSSDDNEKEFENLLEVPMLLIDDLGTEPMMRNITMESLFTLLNERSRTGKHTVISTNLSPIQIQERYGERVMSRMFDRTRCATLLLKGKDLRKK